MNEMNQMSGKSFLGKSLRRMYAVVEEMRLEVVYI